ncbi:NAD(P)H-dependent flavin oxidoreductase [Chloroflexota bacterium]
METKLCHLLDIEYPIIQGGMSLIANAELAAAVSNAGGLGLISPNAGMAPEGDVVKNLRHQIRKAHQLTSNPFGVNLPLTAVMINELIEAAIKEKATVVVTSIGNPAIYTSYLKESGVKVFHVVASVSHARKAEECGVDAVIAEGYESGGHGGFDELPTFVLVPQVVDAVSVPVVAAGGIADARGFIAALALGAEGVQMGTRFFASTECIAHQEAKEAIVTASDTDTVITLRKFGPGRVLKNEVTAKLVEMESSDASISELQAFLGTNRARKGEIEGDLDNGEVFCGAIAGMIREIVSAKEIVLSIIENSAEVVNRLNRIRG